MKSIKLGMTILVMVLTLNSCNNEDSEINDLSQLGKELSEANNLREPTTSVSRMFLNMGVTAINVTNVGEKTIYTFETEKEFGICKVNINWADYTVVLEGGLVYLQSDPEYKLTVKDDKPYIQSLEYEGYAELGFHYEKKEFNLLLLFIAEMTSNNTMKSDSRKVLKTESKGAACSFWDTYYVFTTGFSRSVALENLKEEMEYRENAFYNTANVIGCTKIGTPDTSCVTENHGCVSSQAYCCD